MKPRPPRTVFPFAVTLRAAALITEGDGRPALYISTDGHAGHAQIFRVPEDARVTVKAPLPLPAAPRVFLPAGACATFTAPDGRVSVLALHAVRVCRELLEALEAHAQAVKVWKSGEKEDPHRHAS
ncbi:hypothetical protein [uncultured Deinococcus sp.]|uniref:hypothetical protein n=1 Tax=uncultured Deinococcus sp. TaxID=158789 RepID=UPI002590950D|nr:hypothetical protein [uncultured Deinococcus sp.]